MSWEDPLEEGMATHSSILTWRIPCSEEPGRLQSIGSQRVGHNWSDLACLACVACMHGVHQTLCSKLCRIKCLEASAYINPRRCFCHPCFTEEETQAERGPHSRLPRAWIWSHPYLETPNSCRIIVVSPLKAHNRPAKNKVIQPLRRTRRNWRASRVLESD